MDIASTPIPERADTVVVGAGLGGLLAAVTAAGPGRTVVILEPRPLGGQARCDEREGFTFNRGPRALYVGGRADRELRAAGVDTSRGGRPLVAGGAALKDGALHRFPGTPMDAARTSLLTRREKLATAKVLAAVWRGTDRTDRSETLAAWLDRRQLSPTVRQLVEALVRVSTYANAADVFAAGPALASARAGISPGVRYLDGGWQSLVDQLEAIARSAGVVFAPFAARSVECRDDETVIVHRADGGSIQACSAVLAVGGPDAASTLLGGRPPSWPNLGPPSTAACLELGVSRLPTHRFALGIDEPVYASTHSPPARLAPAGGAVVHLMRYQPAVEVEPVADQRARLIELAHQIGLHDDDIVAERFLARMVVSHALPIAAAGGLMGRPRTTVDEHPGVLLVGDWVGPDGLLLDAVAASATEAGRLASARSATMVSASSRIAPERTPLPSRPNGPASWDSPTASPDRAPRPRTSCRTPGSAGSGPTGPPSSGRPPGSPP